MTKIISTEIRKFLLAIFLLVGSSTAALAQSKFHVDLDYHYNLGLYEKFKSPDWSTSINRSDNKMGGHSLHLTARYDIAARWSAGIGVGLDRYTDPEYNTRPVFATVRYKAIKSVPDLYAFSDLGYSFGSDEKDFLKGFVGNWGIGYTHMFAKHFGMNLQIAYNLKRFSDEYHNYDDSGQPISTKTSNSTRHSISFGVGVTF